MPGTIIVPEDVFHGLLRAVMAGFWNTGFRKMILLNGHGQEWEIPTAMHQFAKKYQVPAVLANVNYFHVIPQEIKSKAHGGPYETGLGHAEEGETSIALSLFPEMVNMENAVDTSQRYYLPDLEHFAKAGEPYQRPLRFYGHVGLVGLETKLTPEGVIGLTTLADGNKAKKGMEQVLDYLAKLHDDILENFPPGKLPPFEEITERPREEIESLLKGPLKGGRSLYTIAYPP
jgi:creatinine amidohydrolase